MTKLMQQCELLDKIQHDGLSTAMSHTVSKGNREVGSVLSLFSGILPGNFLCLLFTFFGYYNPHLLRDKLR